jgi:hypothetical protein
MNITPHFIIICREAFTAAGTNNLSLINIFTQITADRFPFQFSRFALVANFDAEAGGSHVLKTLLVDPSGKQLTSTDVPVSMNPGNMQVIANFEQLQFPVPGAYTFRIFIDDHPLGAQVLDVKPGVARARQKAAIA